MTMKRRHARTLIHTQSAGQRQHDMLLFPWMQERNTHLRHIDSANDSEARKWAWIGVGVIAASALGALGVYSSLLALFF
jgi:hypothetical protein